MQGTEHQRECAGKRVFPADRVRVASRLQRGPSGPGLLSRPVSSRCRAGPFFPGLRLASHGWRSRGSVPDFLSGPCLPVTRCCPSPWAASSCPVALHASSAPVRPCLRSAPRPVVPVSPQPLHRGVLGRVSPGLLPLSSFSRRDHLLVGTCQRNVFASPACSTERVCR